MSDKNPGPKFSDAAPEAKELPPGVVSADNPDVAYEIDYLHPHENIAKPRKLVRPVGSY